MVGDVIYEFPEDKKSIAEKLKLGIKLGKEVKTPRLGKEFRTKFCKIVKSKNGDVDENKYLR